MKIDKLKELEKIADKLGIGQNREVECVSCHKKIQFKDAILLTNKETVSHLCSECNTKLINGELTKKQIDQDEILKQIKRIDDMGKQPTPFTPGPEEYPWKREREPWVMPYRTGDITYQVYTSGNANNDTLLKFEPTRGTGE